MSGIATGVRNLPPRSTESPEDAADGFARRAFREGEARIAYAQAPSPLGVLTVLVTHRGLLSLAFETDDPDEPLRAAAAKVSPDIVHLPSAVREVRSWLDGYFRGHPAPELRLDRSLMTPFQERVLDAAAAIPMGQVRTYGETAAMAGNPKAARAAGRALGANPIPIVLPCHRVVAADGRLHGYAGGLDRKRFLLDHERAAAGRL